VLDTKNICGAWEQEHFEQKSFHPKKILLSPVYIYFGIMKQFLKPFSKTKHFFQVPLQSVSSFVGRKSTLRRLRLS
jgi:hypothetical protein